MTNEIRNFLITLRATLGGKCPLSDTEIPPVSFDLIKDILDVQLTQIENTPEYLNLEEIYTKDMCVDFTSYYEDNDDEDYTPTNEEVIDTVIENFGNLDYYSRGLQEITPQIQEKAKNDYNYIIKISFSRLGG